MNHRLIRLGANVAVALMPQVSIAQTMEAGMWEIVVNMQGAGPAISPQTITRCVTPQEAGNPRNVVPSSEMGKQCKIENSNVSGNRFAFTLQCAQPKLTTRGEFVFAGASYTGSMNTEMSDPSTGTLRVTQQIRARRLGACK